MTQHVPLEQASAIRTIADEAISAAHLGARLADQLRDLDSLAVRFARAYASGEAADPQDLAAAIGAAQALLAATTDALGAVLDARQELRAALVLPEGADVGLEAAAKEELSRRFGRVERLPEDPRVEDTTTA